MEAIVRVLICKPLLARVIWTATGERDITHHRTSLSRRRRCPNAGPICPFGHVWDIVWLCSPQPGRVAEELALVGETSPVSGHQV
jgi:hypothetical protein